MDLVSKFAFGMFMTLPPLTLWLCFFFLTSAWRGLYCCSFIGICVSYCVFEFFVYRFYQLHKCYTNLWSSTCSYLFILAPWTHPKWYPNVSRNAYSTAGQYFLLSVHPWLLKQYVWYHDTFRAQPMKLVNTCKKCSQYAAPSSLPCVYGLGEGGRR